MEISDIIRCREIQGELDALVERYFDSLQNYGEEYSDWKWSPEDSYEIIITYGFWNYHDEWDYGEYHVKFDELINFGKNGTKD